MEIVPIFLCCDSWSGFVAVVRSNYNMLHTAKNPGYEEKRQITRQGVKSANGKE